MQATKAAPTGRPYRIGTWSNGEQHRIDTVDHFNQAVRTIVPMAHNVEHGHDEHRTDFVRLVHYLVLAAPKLGMADLQPLLLRIHGSPSKAWNDCKELLFLLNNPKHRLAAANAPAPRRQPVHA